MARATIKSLSSWKRAILILLAFACCLACIGPVQSESEDSATLQANLGDLIRAGKYDEATVVARKVIANHEKVFGPDHFETAIVVGQLADILRTQGRNEEAQLLYARTLAIFEKVLGPDSRDVAATLGSLALVYKDQGRYEEAEPLYVRSLAILERTLDPGDPFISKALNNLAVLYQLQGRRREAEPLLQRSLALSEKNPDESAIAGSLNNLASLYEDEGRLEEAESLYKRSLDLLERALGPDHPNVATLHANLGMLALLRHQWGEAAEDFRRSAAVIQSRIQLGLTGSDRNSAKGEAQRNSGDFVGQIKATNRLVMDGGADRSEQSRALFETAQWALSSDAAATLAQMALRSANGSAEIATLVRERQDLVREWQTGDRRLVAARSAPPSRRNPAGEAALSDRLSAIDTRLAAIDSRLAKGFPEYAALSSPRPISASDVQTNLRADEALVLFLDTGDLFKPLPEETFVWVVTKSDVRWVRSDLGRNSLTREVAALRCGLDFDEGWTGSRCSDLLKIAYTRADHDNFGKPLPFDLERAHSLYKGLFGQIEELIKDKRLLIVPSGALTQLPFQVLVTEPPKTALPSSAADYRDVAWLARKHAITVLPTVSSLRALRELAKESHASDPYIGFGNPLLDGEPQRFKEDAAAAKLAREKRCDFTLLQRVSSILGLRGGTRAITRSDGGIANIADIRTWAPLPETADELCDVAHDLGVNPASHLYLGAAATETKLKQLSEDGSLATHKIVHFATHGAVAGELSHVSEPGLLLTPPDQASETDDGYLSASEIATLKLDADWVILSACNTAAGGSQGAEALSGLARAFFYAGARSLLVSHWEVASGATVKLITKAVGELKAHPEIGRAEALRRSMLSMITTGNDYEAHPAFWAPFVLVGEGAAAR
jgi:CHAT domain-containing protein/tetratricopeptide (TPR) repeat protein